MSKSKRSNKTESIAEILAKGIANRFKKMSKYGNFWINSKNKETGEYSESMPLNIDKLNKAFSDQEYFNLWQRITDRETQEQLDDDVLAENIDELAELFYQSGYTLGLKYPYLAKSGNAVSYSILKYSNDTDEDES